MSYYVWLYFFIFSCFDRGFEVYTFKTGTNRCGHVNVKLLLWSNLKQTPNQTFLGKSAGVLTVLLLWFRPNLCIILGMCVRWGSGHCEVVCPLSRWVHPSDEDKEQTAGTSESILSDEYGCSAWAALLLQWIILLMSLKMIQFSIWFILKHRRCVCIIRGIRNKSV